MTAFDAYCAAHELGRYSGKADVGIVACDAKRVGQTLPKHGLMFSGSPGDVLYLDRAAVFQFQTAIMAKGQPTEALIGHTTVW